MSEAAKHGKHGQVLRKRGCNLHKKLDTKQIGHFDVSHGSQYQTTLDISYGNYSEVMRSIFTIALLRKNQTVYVVISSKKIFL